MRPEPVVAPELGRSIVVSPGRRPPSPWAGSPVVSLDQSAFRSPGETIDVLHDAWARRRPLVIELGVEPEDLRSATRVDVPPYRLAPDFELSAERLHFLVWANSYDARNGDLVWWHGRKAARRFASEGVHLGGVADVTLADGTPVYIDGGPSHPPELAGGIGVVHRWNAEAGSLSIARHGAPRAGLAPDQLAAVRHATGPARIIAPAGSGKTRVLTERLRHLLADRRVDPSSVTVLAYNAKAADELRDRCADLLTPAGPSIRTINSLGLSICNGPKGATRPTVMGEPEVRTLIESLFAIRHRANVDAVVPYIEALSAIRLGLSAPEEVEGRFPDAAGVAEGFERYRRALAEARAVDFDEQIYRAIEILLTEPESRAAAQRRCRHLLVDEFQDLNPAHLLLIRLLCSPGLDCFGVGDDDQVLYGYSGATPEYLVDYDRYFPGAGHHGCEVNYRCPPAVVRAATNLLSYNELRVDKPIRPAPDRPESPGAMSVRSAPGEQLASLAAAAVSGWRDDGVDWSDMVVLARVNSALLPVQVALSEAGIPCSSTLTARVLGRTGARTAFAYLRMGTDPDRISRRDVEDTIRRPSRGIAPNVAKMLMDRPQTSVSDIERLADALTGKDGPKLHAYAADIAKVARACRKGTAAALRAIRIDVKLGETMDVLDASRDEPDRSTHHDDLMALESVAVFHPDAATFEPWLAGVLARPQSDGPSVLLSTVHRIKGREWSRVVLYGATAGLFPHRLGDDVEGERRVFHVALTRATDEVVVLADAEAPSFFLRELDGTRPRVPLSGAADGSGGAGTGRDRGPGTRERGGGGRARAAAAAGPAAGNLPVEATEASTPLRTWRTDVARREGMPPYIVLTDRQLEGIVAAAPGTLAELAGCKGIGPAKLERWGDEILAVLHAP